ncbi:hypothetical protein AX15_003074 [Amanita polypyramis BW_CC]|nr:hypothetical protein AX15_003074 [Amanita polypyramis BW_CC]
MIGVIHTRHNLRNQACVACRRDKIRCDGARPCTSCARKGYQCIERSSAPCPECGQEKECMHQSNAHNTSEPKPQATQLIAMQQLPGPGQPMQPPGFNQPIYPMTGLIQELYMPGSHQTALVQHSGFIEEQKQEYIPTIDPSVGGSSMPP